MKKILDKFHIPTWLFILLSLIFILRIPSFFEPYSYGDEMIYLTLGEGIRQGATLYKGIYDNKPPLIYIIAAIAGNLFWSKVILAFWNLITIVLFWNLIKALFPGKNGLQKVSTTLFAVLTTIPLLEGNIVNAELFMIGPIIAGFLILLTRKLDFKNLFFAGTLFSLATLFKVPAFFDIPPIIIYWLITGGFKKDNLIRVVKNTLIIGLGFAFPILITFIWFFFQGALKEYLTSAFLQNIGYLSTWRPGMVKESFLIKNLPLLIRAAIVLFGSGILYIFRKKLSKEFILATLWLLFTLFAATLSERPYPHYLVQTVAPLTILIGFLFAEKNYEQSLSIIPLTLAFFAPVYFHFWYYATAPYYLRFSKFATGQISRDSYFSSFSSVVPRNYKIAEFIDAATKRKDRIFVTGDSSVIYALSHRLPAIKYAADYHINDYSSKGEEVKNLEKAKPFYIIVLPESRDYPNLYRLLKKSYFFITDIDGAEIWKLSTFLR